MFEKKLQVNLFLLNIPNNKFGMLKIDSLTPKRRRPFFGLFLEFEQPIADAIFVQKISNFW
jgi:hypothetical protein